MSQNELELAEALVRRSLKVENNLHTRRMLGDILTAQKAFVKAIAEYKEYLLSDILGDKRERDQIILRFISMLRSTGREDEIDDFRALVALC